MTEQRNELQARLEEATAPEPLSEVVLDSEAASLRDAWLALGELLEAADAGLDDQRLVQRLCRASRRSRWLWVAAGTLAASLLVALGMLGRSHDSTGQARDNRLARQAAAPRTWPVDQTLPNGLDRQIEPPTRQPPDERFAWDDCFDERIAQVHSQIVRLRGNWRCTDGSIYAFRQQLWQIEQEINESSL